MGNDNLNLRSAKSKKNDEFYTQLNDISRELAHYKPHFANKTVFCNCDDPTYSNFWRYFHLNFSKLGLHRLIATHYTDDAPSYMLEYLGGDDNNINDGIITPLVGNGDFRSSECVNLLQQSDIVVTNPPFSCFREYLAQLMEYNKKFVIIGNCNALTYKEVFLLIKDNKIWMGYDFNKTYEFVMPDSYQLKGKAFIDSEGKKHGYVQAISWFTNLDISKRYDKIKLWRRYNPQDYSVFDEIPSLINVNKVSDIPYDYDGLMAVPITFMNKYCPDQFEIVEAVNRYTLLDYFGVNEDVRSRRSHCCNIDGSATYFRVVIRKKTPLYPAENT